MPTLCPARCLQTAVTGDPQPPPVLLHGNRGHMGPPVVSSVLPVVTPRGFSNLTSAGLGPVGPGGARLPPQPAQGTLSPHLGPGAATSYRATRPDRRARPHTHSLRPLSTGSGWPGVGPTCPRRPAPRRASGPALTTRCRPWSGPPPAGCSAPRPPARARASAAAPTAGPRSQSSPPVGTPTVSPRQAGASALPPGHHLLCICRETGRSLRPSLSGRP